MAKDEIRLINAVELEKQAYARFGLEAIKFITLIQEQPTANALPLQCGDKESGDKNGTHITRT